MRSTRKLTGPIAAVVAVLLATVLAVVPGAGAARAQEPPAQISSHCGGLILTQANYDTESATSMWLFNSSLLFPPVCEQDVAILCGESIALEGNPTVDVGEVSTATCPAGAPLSWVLSGTRHAD